MFLQTQRFGIMLLVRKLPGVDPSKFQFQPCPPSLAKLNLDVAANDVLHNFTNLETMTMDNNSKPWRGAREKDPRLLQMLIQRCSFPNDVIMDCNAATGNII